GVDADGWSSKAVPPPKTVTVRCSAWARAMSSESSAMLPGLASRGSASVVRLIPTSVDLSVVGASHLRVDLGPSRGSVYVELSEERPRNRCGRHRFRGRSAWSPAANVHARVGACDAAGVDHD